MNMRWGDEEKEWCPDMRECNMVKSVTKRL